MRFLDLEKIILAKNRFFLAKKHVGRYQADKNIQQINQ
jgi:hypothetical protein